jgi:hypothetical protein
VQFLPPSGGVTLQKKDAGHDKKARNKPAKQAPVATHVSPPQPATKLSAAAPEFTPSAHGKQKRHMVNILSKEGADRITDLLPGRHICECLASRHKLINNCLECGRVVCVQEGSGPCMFCGSMVCTAEEAEILQRNSRKSEKLREKLEDHSKPAEVVLAQARAAYTRASNAGQVAQYFDDIGAHHAQVTQDADAAARAKEHKDRLVQFDRTSARRTKVIDDQSDYFSADSNRYAVVAPLPPALSQCLGRWLTPEQRAALQQKEAKIRAAQEEAKYSRTMTFDFAGRRGAFKSHL